MAIGASPADVLALITRQGMRLVGAGLVIGLCGSLALAGTLDGFLFGVGARDMSTYASAAGGPRNGGCTCVLRAGTTSHAGRTGDCVARRVIPAVRKGLMAGMKAWLNRLAGFFGTRQGDAEFIDELNGHLDAHTADNIRAGMSSDAARHEALVRFGGVTQTAEAYRDQRRLPFVEIDHAGSSLRAAGCCGNHQALPRQQS